MPSRLQVMQLSARHPDVVPALGLHPWFVAARSEGWLAALRCALKENPHAGVGEVRWACGFSHCFAK